MTASGCELSTGKIGWGTGQTLFGAVPTGGAASLGDIAPRTPKATNPEVGEFAFKRCWQLEQPLQCPLDLPACLHPGSLATALWRTRSFCHPIACNNLDSKGLHPAPTRNHMLRRQSL